MKLAILFMVVGFCMPAYAEVAIYKVKGKVSGLDITHNENLTVSWKGFLLVQVDVSQEALEDAIIDDILAITEIDGEGDVCGLFYDTIEENNNSPVPFPFDLGSSASYIFTMKI